MTKKEVFTNGYIVLYEDKTGYSLCGPEDEEGLRKLYEAMKELFEKDSQQK